ncbi:MAG: hypothetical protein K6A95_07930 [Bacteroidales bacterium]|nr:hypothetical protein [Bacteroidales bacterium]
MRFSVLLALIFIGLGMQLGLRAQGTGTEADPFLINSKADLENLRNCVNSGAVFYYNTTTNTFTTSNGTGFVSIPRAGEGKFFKLTADITLNSGDVAAYDGESTVGWETWTPIGSQTVPFNGTFDGDFHLISGLFVNQTTDNAGFFGQTSNHATIKQLGIVNSHVAGGSSCGGIVGYALAGNIDKCFYTGAVSGTGSYVGGLVGQISSGTIISTCYTSATVSAGGSQLGGLIGRINSPSPACTIQNVYAASVVTGTLQFTGALVGENLNVSTSFSNVYANKQLVALQYFTPNSIGTQLSTAVMTADDWRPSSGFDLTPGGLYPIIHGFSLDSSMVLFSVVHIILPDESTLSDLSAVDEITLSGTPQGVTWSMEEMVGLAEFTGSNTLGITGQSYVILRASRSGTSRVYLLQFDKTPYIGTESNPFTINNLADLSAVRNGVNTGVFFSYKHFTVPALGENTHFLQTADITHTSSNWNSIGWNETTPFKGIYDGGNHAIINWKNSTATSAFFRYTENATIKNLTMRKVGTANYASLIYSMNGGTVDNCHSVGSTTVKGGLIHMTAVGENTCYIRKSTNRNNFTPPSGATDMGGIVSYVGSAMNYMDSCHNYGNLSNGVRMGGLVGCITANANAEIHITHSSNQGNITSTNYSNDARVGGLSGVLNAASTISYSFNKGNVSGYADYVAGIAGAAATVRYCYNLGSVTGGNNSNGSVRHCFVMGISVSAATRCFNAGRITNRSSNEAYAISSNGGTDCFNAGEVITAIGTAVSLSSGNQGYTIGRLSGSSASIGGSFVDKTRTPSYSSSDNAAVKTTSQMTGSQLSLGSNWVYATGRYPRINGLDTLAISKALCLPITLAGTDDVDHVSANFTVASDYGIQWRIDGTSGATISGPSGNVQTVTLPSTRTGGNIILAAYRGDSTYYRITLRMAVAAPTAPLTVDNLTDLQALRDGINSGAAFAYKGTAVPASGEGTTFKMTADITITGGINWVSIGLDENPFKGIFDGDGHNISGLRQYNADHAGLFGYVEGGTIKNLNLVNVNIDKILYGGSVCYVLRSGVIDHCTAAGTLAGGGSEYHGHRQIGGIVASASHASSIKYCTNYLTITGSTYCSVGGIIGNGNSDTRIDTCINAGDISGAEFIGGICANGGKMYGCINYGNLTGQTLSRGIAGISVQTIDGHGYATNSKPGCVYGCVNSGKIAVPIVSSTCYIAGVASRADTVDHCYNVGMVEGNNANYASGVAASATTVRYSFNAGPVKGSGTTVCPVWSGTGTRNFYDSQMSIATEDRATPKTTIEMCSDNLRPYLQLDANYVYQDSMYPRIKGIENLSASKAIASPIFLVATDAVTFVDSNFRTGGCDDHGVVWTSTGNSLVVSGCADSIANPGMPDMQASINDTLYKVVPLQVRMDAFIIKDREQLDAFRARINGNSVFYYNAADSTYWISNPSNNYITVPKLGEGATFRLHQDIDYGGATIGTPIGGQNASTAFKGTFDGNNKMISNFVILSRNNGTMGFFGYVDNAYIRNLILDHASGTFSSSYGGVLAGRIYTSTITNITIQNSRLQSSTSYLGGIAGFMQSSNLSYIHLIDNEFSGTSYVGGAVGSVKGNAISYSDALRCTVTASGNYVGGFAGYITQEGVGFTQRYINVDTCHVSGVSNVGGFVGSHVYNHGGSPVSIHVHGGDVTGTGSNVGGVYGSGGGLGGDGVMSNSARVTGKNNVGGIVGNKSHRNMYNCINTGDVTGEDYVGGVVGNESHPSGNYQIYYCVNAGKVTGRNYVGGIRAISHHTDNSTTTGCLNLGDVTGETYVGGITGFGQGKMTQSMNVGRITGVAYVGGLVGQQTNYPGFSKTVSSGISCGQVYGDDYVGSIVGDYEAGTVTGCYYDKQMSQAMGLGTTGADAAGVAVGKYTREMIGTALTGISSGFTKTAGLYPMPTSIANSGIAMNVAAARVAAAPVVLADTVTTATVPGRHGYEVAPSVANNVQWAQTAGNIFLHTSSTFTVNNSGMAVLTASLEDGKVAKNVYFVVGISRDLPFIIKDYEQLTNFTNLINSGSRFYYDTQDSTFYANDPGNMSAIAVAVGGEGYFFKLGFDPSFQLETWAGRIGTTASPFLGDFNGGNHMVTYLPKSTTDTSGFFGYNGGIIYDLTVTPNMANDSIHDVVGALVGYNAGRISNCHVVNGKVWGHNNVGGVVGVNAGFITGCHNSAQVTASSNVGGVCGLNENSLFSVFNLGDVSAYATTNTYLGGVVGWNKAILTDCYNVGNITATGTSSKYVGGVVGYNGSDNFARAYNVGQITAPSLADAGAVVGGSTNTVIPSLAFDNQMCTSVTTAFPSSNNNATTSFTVDMTGTSLRTLLDNEHWVYSDSLYPRLANMQDLNASILSTSPIFLTGGERVTSVGHDFNAYTAGGTVDWTSTTDALDMSALPLVSRIKCGMPVLTATRGIEHKTIALELEYTGSVIVEDTTCSEPYTWDVDGITYYSSNTVLVNRTVDGCPYTYTLRITIPAPLRLAIDSTAESCYHANDGEITTTVTGGFSPYFYEWRNESDAVVGTGANLDHLVPGRYFLTVMDTVNADHCRLDSAATIDAATQLVMHIDTANAGCYGSVDGFFTVSFQGGKAPYVLSWSGAASGSRDISDPQPTGYTVDALPDGNYEIRIQDANHCETIVDTLLQEVSTPYVVTAYSEEKMYDGVAVHANQYSLKIGDAPATTYYSNFTVTLANGDQLTAEVEADECLDAGTYRNNVLSCVVMRGSQDVTCLYNLTTVNGNVVIQKRNVVITSADSTAYYDNTQPDRQLNCNRVVVTGDGFTAADAALVTYTYTGGQVGGGSSYNTFTINWNGVNDDNYTVSTVNGLLTLIENGVLVVRAANLNRTYDGTSNVYAPTAEGTTYTVTAYYVRDLGGGVMDTVYGLGPEYHVDVVMNNGATITMKDADTVPNRVTEIHAWKGTTEVTRSFQRNDTIHGVLQVNPREVTLTSASNTWEYDGYVHTAPTVTVTGNFVEADIDAAPTATGSITDYGTTPNTIAIHPSASYQARNYDITEQVGDLEITKRPLHLAGITTYVDYNGNLQQTTDFTYGNLVNGHTASGVSYLAQGREVGGYDGVFSGTLAVRDGSDNDVTVNYQPDTTIGKLWIRSLVAELNITSTTKSSMYTGSPLTSQKYNVTFSSVPVNSVVDDFHFRLSTGDTLVITPTNGGVSGQLHVGSVRNDYSWTIVPSEHLSNYENVTLDTGLVIVTPRPVTLSSASDTKVYDGTPIENNSVTVGGSLFVEGEGVNAYTYSNPGNWKDVGEYRNEFGYTLTSATQASDYAITLDTGLLRITPAELTVTANDITRFYGEPNEFTYTITGYQGTDNASAITGLASITYDCDGTQYSPIGTYIITPVVTGLSAMNYTFAEAPGTLTIQKRNMVVHARCVSAQYNGQEHNATNTPTTISQYVGLAAGDVATVDLRYARTVAGSTHMAINSIAIAHGSDDVTNNYTVTISDTSYLQVTKLPLRIRVVDTTKVYDGSALTASRYIVDGTDTLAEGDVISPVHFTGSQTEVGSSASNINTGSGEFIIMHGSQDVFNQNQSYQLTVIPGTLTVTPSSDYTLTCPSGAALTKVYDGTALMPTATVSGYVAGNTFSVEYSTDSIHWSATPLGITQVGTQRIHVRSVNTQGNYTDKACDYTLTITPATLRITLATTKEYDGTPMVNDYFMDPTGFDIVGLAAGQIVVRGTVTSPSAAVGTYADNTGANVTAAFTTSDGIGNYNVIYDLEQEITPSSLTISLDTTKVFDGEVFVSNYDHASVHATGLAAGDYLTAGVVTSAAADTNTYRYSGTPATTPTGFETHNGIGNYNVTYDLKQRITQQPLTIALNTNKVYDGSKLVNDYAASADGYTITGLVAGDAITAGAVSTETANVGSYQDSLDTDFDAEITTDFTTTKGIANYKVTYDLHQNITPATLTIRLDTTRIYNGLPFVSDYTSSHDGYTFTGLVAGDNITQGLVTTSNDTVGVYRDSIDMAKCIPADFATTKGIGNYTVVYDLKQTITQAALTITLDTTKTYDGLVFTSTYAATGAGYTVTGLQNGATVTAGVVTSAGETVGIYRDSVAPAANITIDFATSDGIANYAVVYDFSQEITKRNLTIKLDTTKTYDGLVFTSTYAATGAGYTVTGLQNGATVTAGVVTSSSANVGVYRDSISSTESVPADFATTDGIGNYNVIYDLKQEITPKALTIRLDTTKFYDGTNFVSDYTDAHKGYAIIGLVATDHITAGVVNSGNANVGTYAANDASLVSSPFVIDHGITNYNVTYDLKQVIAPRNLTIKLDTTKTYDGLVFTSTYAATGAGYTVTGLQNGATVTAGVVTSAGEAVGIYRDSVTPAANITTDFATTDGISNYNVTYDLKQEITKRDLTIKLDTAKVYDGTAFVSTYAATGAGYTVTGLQNGATITAGVATSAGEAVGIYRDSVTPAANITTDFATSDGISNYNVTYDLKQEITKLTLDITARDTTWEYDGITHSLHSYEYALNGAATPETVPTSAAGVVTLATGDVLTVTFNPLSVITDFATAGQINNIQSYTIMNGSTDVSSNYTVTTTDGTLRISKKPATVTACTQAFTYDGAVHTCSTITTSGLVGSDAVSAVISGSIQFVSQSPVTNEIVMISFTTGNSENYAVTLVNGELTMTYGTPVELRIVADDGTWPYDGTTHTQDSYVLTYDGNDYNVGAAAGVYTFANGDQLTVDVTGSIIDYVAGGVSNVPTVVSILHGTEDVSPAYDVTTTPPANGTLTITKVNAAVTADGATKMYDGTALTDNGWSDVAPTGIVTGDHVESVTVTGTQTAVGTSDNVPSNAVIIRGTTDVTDNYNITYHNGTLEVTKRDVTLTSETASKFYDGTPLERPVVTVTGSGFVAGEVTNIHATGTITMIGSVTNTIVYDPQTGFDANNYTITINEGTLTVEGSVKPFAFTSADGTWVYDGVNHTRPEYTVVYDGVNISAEAGFDGLLFRLPTGDTLTITPTCAGITNVGTVNNSFTYTIQHSEGYLGTRDTTIGVLEVTQRPIDIVADDFTYMFDGVEHTYAEGTSPFYTVESESTGRGLLSGHTVTAVLAGARTDAGTTSIVPSAATIMSGSDDVTANYAVNYVNGTLTITPRTGVVVTIQEHGAEYDYDGMPKTVTGYTFSSNDPLYLESYIAFTGDATVTGTGNENSMQVYPMTLAPIHFSNVSPNFTGVVFHIADSALYIYPMLKAALDHQTDISCHGFDDGEAVIKVTGGKKIQGKYKYAIDGGADIEDVTPHTFTGLTPGGHSVVVTDSLGYTSTVNFNITQPDPLEATITTPVGSCPNQGSYDVSVVVTGGTLGYHYEWSGDAADADAAATTVAQIGANDSRTTYTVDVTVSDAHTCTVTSTETFTVKPSVNDPTILTNIVNPAHIDSVLQYGVMGITLTLTPPTYTNVYPEMPLTLVNDAPSTNYYYIPNGQEDSVYVIHWRLLDTCGGERLLFTQTVAVHYPTCSGTVIDADNHSYMVVRLGGNCWTRSNMASTVYGSESMHVNGGRGLTRDATNGRYIYNDDNDLYDKFGYLYSWYSACNVEEGANNAVPATVNGHIQGICPDGWAIPTVNDYIQMVIAAGDMSHVKHTSTEFWQSGMEGVLPSSGFDAKGAGYYDKAMGSYESLYAAARFWTVTPTGSNLTATAVQCAVCESEEVIIKPKGDAFSVRCVRVQ